MNTCVSVFQQGRQEDAEEFLGVILDSLHEEMVSAMSVSTNSESLIVCV